MSDITASRALRETSYEIRDASGMLQAVHVRVDSPDGKQVYWRRADGRPGLAGMAVTDLPLFGIERLGPDPLVVLTEGEKASQALVDAGVPAVGTVTGAATTPSSVPLSELSGRSVVLWPDNDEVGRAHMQRIARQLGAIASDVRWAEWVGAPPHGDAADLPACRNPWDIVRDAGRVPDTPGDGAILPRDDFAMTRVERLAPLAGRLEAFRAFATRYVAFASEHQPVAVALWIEHAWRVDEFETSPILAVTSAEMRSGKTRLLDVLELLVPAPFRVVMPSEAVVYTVLAQRPRRTMLLDEADAVFGPRTAERYEGLRAILNSGNRIGTPVLRVLMKGRSREIEEFDVFGPKAIAGIGDLPDTVADRSIPIRLKRRSPTEPVGRFRHRIAVAEAALIPRAEPVALGTDVTVPDELPDRAADSWEPLLAIAQAAGGPWPAWAWAAAVALSAESETPASTGMRLLADLREVFGSDDHVATADLLLRLHELEGAPWGDWLGKPLNARNLALLLEPYRVAPHLRRLGSERHRGYFATDFADIWARYVSPRGEAVPTVTSVPPEPDDLPHDKVAPLAMEGEGLSSPNVVADDEEPAA